MVNKYVIPGVIVVTGMVVALIVGFAVYAFNANSYQEDCSGNKLIPHPVKCNAYFKCARNQYTEQSCPANLNFNAETLECDLPQVVKCIIPATGCNDEEEFLPHPYKCNSYLKCIYGLYEEITCPDGLHFNPTKLWCDFPSLAKCPLYAQCSEDKLIPHPSICGDYLECVNGEYIEKSCPDGLYFNTDRLQCDHRNVANCTPEVHCPEDSFLPSDNECDAYLKCINGTYTEMPCPDGLHFNADSFDCDLPILANCPSESACIHSEYISHPTNCNAFLECVGGKYVVMPCPAGLYFNVAAQWCDWPQNVDCAADSECFMGEFISNSSNCSAYLECVNGEYIEKLCPDNLYFNADLSACDLPETVYCPSESSCTDNELMAHPTTCNLYLKCVAGNFIEVSCPDGLYFDRDTLECELTSITNCDLSKTACANDEKIRHPTRCDTFLQCNDGDFFEILCSDDMLFNDETLECDWPENVICSTKPEHNWLEQH